MNNEYANIVLYQSNSIRPIINSQKLLQKE